MLATPHGFGDDDRSVAEVIVAMHRSGPTGTERLAFLDRYTRFANMARA